MIQVDMLKAKEIAHEKRRHARSEEFKPLDVQATIPLMVEEAEAQRQIIREKYDAIQVEIDNAATVNDLKEIITQL